MASVSNYSRGYGLTDAQLRARNSELFSFGSTRTGSILPASVARSKETATTAGLRSRQLAVTTELQNLRKAVAEATFSTPNVANTTEYAEIREDRERSKVREITRTETVYGKQDIRSVRDVIEQRNVIETHPVFETRDVTEARDVFETRDVYEDQAVFEDRDVFESQDIFETRDVFETRDITETRPVYAQQELRATTVDGTRDLQSFNRINQAGIDVGADFSVRVGTGATATIRFATNSRITVTTGGTTTNFNFTNNNGSWRGALVSALDSVAGLDASLDSGGKLQLATAGAQSLTIADVANGASDNSGSPLSGIGLLAGTTQSSVIGYEQVETGIETIVTGTVQIKTGTEQVKIGMEHVKTGTERVQIGTQPVLTGQEQVRIGSENVVVGTEQVQTGTQDIVTGTQGVIVGRENYVSGQKQIVLGQNRFTQQVSEADGLESVLIGFSRSYRIDESGSRLDTAGRRGILERTQALEAAIGGKELSRGVDNPFAKLGSALDLASIRTISTAAERDSVLARLDVALKTLGVAPPVTGRGLRTTGGLAALGMSAAAGAAK